MTEEGPRAPALRAGMIVIVRRGAWHRFETPNGVTLMTATPHPTDHPPVHVEDPWTMVPWRHWRGIKMAGGQKEDR